MRKSAKSELTEKQKEFGRLLFDGLSQGDAYRKAFKCKGKSDSSVNSAASRLAKDVKISAFIASLNAEVNKSKVLTKQERMEWLSELIVTPTGKVDSDSNLCQEYRVDDAGNVICKMPSKIAAIAELNKMDGAYEPEKVETTVSFLGSVLKELPAQPLKANE